MGSPNPNFTLEGHEKGVNCVDYYSGGDKPYIISGADDHIVKIWDYQVRRHLFSSCIAIANYITTLHLVSTLPRAKNIKVVE